MKIVKYLTLIILSLIFIWITALQTSKFISSFEEEKIIVAEPGDILARVNSNLAVGSAKYFWGGFTGHMGIIVKGGTFSTKDQNLGGIEIAEARLFRRHPFGWTNNVSVNRARENFGTRFMGRRFLLKTKLTKEEREKLIKVIQQYTDRHYSLFSKKVDSTFNCATFTRRVILESSGMDLDYNGGNVVFPNDIIANPIFDSENRRLKF